MADKKYERMEDADYEKMEDKQEVRKHDVSVEALKAKFERLKVVYTDRDIRMSQVAAIREGRMAEIAPDVFPDTGSWQQPIVANMIDIAARDISDMLAPLPSFNCTSPSMVSERARENASMKTKIAIGYSAISKLQVQMYTAADWYISNGFLPFKVECNYEASSPVIRAIDPTGVYPEYNNYGDVTAIYQRLMINRDELAAQYPELAHKIKMQNGLFTTAMAQTKDIEVVFYHDKDWDLAFANDAQGSFIIEKTRNKIGKIMWRVAKRPGPTKIPRGQFDDVIFLQLAKAAFALLQLEAAHESVKAPIVLPNDVSTLGVGAGTTIRTNNPAGVGRLRLDVPQSVFIQGQTFDKELQQGSRFPQVRTGNADASIVTGKGVQALMGGYESQIAAHQAILARVLEELMSLCFEVDEKVFGEMKKTIHASNHGAPFEISYVPSKIINGDYTVDVRYGLMAGLDPNRAMVYGLQARAEKLFSRDTMRREMPLDIDVEEEKRKVQLEDLEDATFAALLGYSQAIPQLAAQGQDPSKIVSALVQADNDIRKGKSIIESMKKLFPEPAPAPAPSPEAAQGGMSPEEQMMAMMSQGEQPPMSPEEQMMMAAQGQGGAPLEEGPTAPPDLQTLLSGLNAQGEPSMAVRSTRNRTI
jgi:hypothetical protein